MGTPKQALMVTSSRKGKRKEDTNRYDNNSLYFYFLICLQYIPPPPVYTCHIHVSFRFRAMFVYLEPSTLLLCRLLCSL